MMSYVTENRTRHRVLTAPLQTLIRHMRVSVSPRLLRLAAAVLLVGTAPVFAQQPPSSAADESGTLPTIQEVVVTGSRIPQANMTSPSPIDIVGSRELQQNGITDVHSLMDLLPQNFQNGQTDLGPNQNPLSSAGGESTADLRGLGPTRTLVLVDGRRLGVGDASTLNPNPAPDLNQIPAALIDRVEVVTGGASAVYGSDAIAGVVNFVMKHDFQGIQLDAQYGIDQHDNNNSLMEGLETQAGFNAPKGSLWDGQNRNMSVIMGSNFADDKGNVEAYFTYLNQDPVTEGSRDFSGCLLHVQPSTSNPLLYNQPFCDGSPNSNLVSPVANSNNSLTVVGTSLLPWPQAGSSPPGLFNSSPYEYLTVQDTRYNAGFFSHYDVNDYVKPFMDFSFMRDTTTSDIAPSGAFEGGNPNDPTGNGGFLVNCSPTNPLLSSQQNAALCGNAANFFPATTSNPTPNVYPGYNADTAVDLYLGRRNIEGGPRTADYEHENYRVVFGSKGDFAEAWNYEAYGSYYSTSLFQAVGGYLSNSRIQNALLVNTNTTTGQPQCQGGQAGCVPYNIWTQGGVTPAQLAYLTVAGTSQGTVTERILAANVTGQLGKYGIISPLATDGIAVNLGVEHRNDQLTYSPDAEELADDLAGYSGAGVSINNGYRVNEQFIELRAPLMQQQPFAEQLTLGAAFRRSDYNTSGSVNTFKLDVEYAPVKDVMARFSFDRAIRAPNLIELYTPQSVTNTTVVGADPCAGATPTASAAECAFTHVSAAEYGRIAQCPAGQCSTLTGGNLALQPERADTLSFGFTFTPQMVEGLTATVDYYRIQLSQEVGVVPQDITLNECLAGVTSYCSDVVRTSSGALFGTTVAGGGYVVATNQNIARAEVSGIDLQLNYHWLVGAFGSMSTTMTGTWLQNQKSQPIPSDEAYNCAGLYGVTCQTVNPRWRHIARVNWQTPWNVLLSAQWRFIGQVSLDNNTGNPLLATSAYAAGAFDSFDAKLPNMNYLDLSAMYEVTKTLSVRLGVNNVLDKDPPIVNEFETTTGAPNTYPSYDLLGRQMYVAFTAKF
jgi:iron complex outermembrane recepter protein